MSKKIRQEENYVKMIKWLDIHKDFWTISTDKMTRYSQKIFKCQNVPILSKCIH